MHRARIPLLYVGLIAVASSGCDPAPSSQRENSPEPRLAVLSPAMTIILRDLGAESHIVGRHAYDLILDSSPIPVVGNELGIDYEALISVEPDVILIEGNQRGVPERLTSLATNRDWRIETIPLLTLDDVSACVTRLDTLVNPPDGTQAGRDLTDQLDETFHTAPEIQRTLAGTIALASTDPPGVLGPGSFHYQLLERLGADALPEEGMPYISWTIEDLKLADPDSLVIFAPGSQESLKQILKPLERIGLRAIEQERVFIIRHPLCHTPSTALLDVAAELRRSVGGGE